MKVNYKDWEETQNNKSANNFNNRPYVGYFTLKEEQESFIRILVDEISDLDIVACHWAFFDGRAGWVNCPRAPKDPVDNCPYCKDNNNIQYRVFIKLIEYTKDEKGNIKPLAKIWDRPASFVKILQDRINDYGPLSNIICKVKRHGTGTSTVYDVLPQNNAKFTETDFPKMENAFKDFNIFGHSVREIPSEKPQAPNNENTSIKEQTTPSTILSSPEYNSPLNTNTNNSENTTQNTEFTRPRRFYS